MKLLELLDLFLSVPLSLSTIAAKSHRSLIRTECWKTKKISFNQQDKSQMDNPIISSHCGSDWHQNIKAALQFLSSIKSNKSFDEVMTNREGFANIGRGGSFGQRADMTRPNHSRQLAKMQYRMIRATIGPKKEAGRGV